MVRKGQLLAHAKMLQTANARLYLYDAKMDSPSVLLIAVIFAHFTKYFVSYNSADKVCF